MWNSAPTESEVSSTLHNSLLNYQLERCQPFEKAELMLRLPGFYSILTNRSHLFPKYTRFVLGNFAWFLFAPGGVCFVRAGFVRDDVMHANLIGKREIWTTVALQHFPLSPPADQRGRRA